MERILFPPSVNTIQTRNEIFFGQDQKSVTVLSLHRNCDCADLPISGCPARGGCHVNRPEMDLSCRRLGLEKTETATVR